MNNTTPAVRTDGRFAVAGGPAGEPVHVTAEDATGRTLRFEARAQGVPERNVAETAAELARRAATLKTTDRPCGFETAWIDDIPVLIGIPAGTTAAPVVLFHHGTGGCARDQLFAGVPLVEAGFFTVLMDGRNHGRRRAADWDRLYGGAGYKEVYLDALIGNCEDVSRILDALEADARADSTRVGCAGISQGGFVTFMAITREPRIGVAAPIIGSPDLEDTFGSSAPFDTYPAALQARLREHSPLRHAERMPPTALFVQNGAQDGIVPVGGTRRLDTVLRLLYADAPERYRYTEYPAVAHDHTPMLRPAINWLVQHLRP